MTEMIRQTKSVFELMISQAGVLAMLTIAVTIGIIIIYAKGQTPPQELVVVWAALIGVYVEVPKIKV